MASKSKFKTFCRIVNFLEEHHSHIYDLLRGTCSDSSLMLSRDKPGITFLLPTNAKLIAEIEKKAYSDDPEQSQAACAMLNSLIIFDNLRSGATWSSHSSDLCNANYQKVAFEKASGETATLKGGSCKLNKTFKDASKKAILSVWDYDGEAPPETSGPSSKTYFIARKDKPMRADGEKRPPRTAAAYEGGAEQCDRELIAAYVNTKYMKSRQQGDLAAETYILGSGDEPNVYETLGRRPYSAGIAAKNIYLEVTMDLCAFIKENDEDMFLNVVLPIISFQNADFFNLIEPYRADSDHVLPDDLLSSWWGGRGTRRPTNTLHMINCIFECVEASKSQSEIKCALFCEPEKLIRCTDEIRREINGITNARSYPLELAKIYATLSSSNRIGKCADVFPATLAAIYQRQSTLKQKQDEIRYVSYLRFKNIEEAQTFDTQAFKELLIMVDNVQSSAVSELFGESRIRYSVSPRDDLPLYQSFVNSTHFCYGIVSQRLIEKYPLKTVILRVGNDYSKILNIEASFLAQLGSRSMTSLDKLMSADKIDPELAAKFVQQLRQNPAAVRSALEFF